jgi:hypothetical protein
MKYLLKCVSEITGMYEKPQGQKTPQKQNQKQPGKWIYSWATCRRAAYLSASTEYVKGRWARESHGPTLH